MIILTEGGRHDDFFVHEIKEKIKYVQGWNRLRRFITGSVSPADTYPKGRVPERKIRSVFAGEGFILQHSEKRKARFVLIFRPNQTVKAKS